MSDAPSPASNTTRRPNAARENAAREQNAPQDSESASTHDLPYRDEFRRKALHLLALILPLGVAVLGKTWALVVLVPSSLLALCCDTLRARSARFARLIHRIFGGMMRPDEWKTGSVSINGATWVLVTMTLLTLIFPVLVATAAFTLFMIGDAAAALVGRRYGRTFWGSGPRTVEGTVAFVGAGLATALLFSSDLLVPLFPAGALPFWVGAVGALSAAAAEAVPRPFNDNLRVPFVAALVLFLLQRLILGVDASLFF